VRPGTPRLHLRRGAEAAPGCPGEGAACRAAAYLTPGDTVLTGPASGAHTCAGFLGASGAMTVGWLPTAALAPVSPSSAQALLAAGAERGPAAWIGRWTAPERRVAIAPGRDGALLLRGDATWGGNDPDRLARGTVRTGEVEGEARPLDGVLAFAVGPDGRTRPHDAADALCRIRLWRRGPYLLARDNGGCGGANVTFTAFYRREAPP